MIRSLAKSDCEKVSDPYHKTNEEVQSADGDYTHGYYGRSIIEAGGVALTAVEETAILSATEAACIENALSWIIFDKIAAKRFLRVLNSEDANGTVFLKEKQFNDIVNAI